MASAIARSPTFGMPPRGRRRLQRGALYVVLASVAVSAAMGAFALLIGGFWGDAGQPAGQLALRDRGERDRGRVWVRLGARAAGGWCRRPAWRSGSPASRCWSSGSGRSPRAIRSSARAARRWRSRSPPRHASLVSPFGLARRFRAAFAAAYGLNALLTALVVYAIWAEPDEGGFWRFTGTVAILVAAATIAIPVLHRLGPAAPSFQPAEAAAAAEAVEAAAALAARYCPRCGAGLERPGAGRCERCGAGFAVRFRAARSL